MNKKNTFTPTPTFIPYEQAQKLAQIISEQHHITTSKDWFRLMQKSEPVFLPFEEAREFVKNLGLKSIAEWKKYCSDKKFNTSSNSLPSRPPEHYKNKWTSWGDFLGTVNSVPSKFADYETAKCFVHCIKPRINNCKEWDEYCKSGKKPKDIPHSPQKIYKEHGWIGWDCWFGSGLYELGISDEEVQNQINFEREHIEEQMENVRYSYDTDEELLEAYEQEASDIIGSVKKYIEANPRNDKE